MLDFTDTPSAGNAIVQTFIGNMRTVTGTTMTWTKPRGISMVHILALGQGGNGVGSTAGATSAGGAGGGSGGQSQLLIPARMLPDILYIGAGAGGAGTAIATIVAARPHGATYNSIPLAQDTYLIAGGAIGNAATAGAVGTIATAILSGKGIANFLAGLAGGAGGAATGAAGVATAANTTGLMVSGGGGGGGMSAAAAFAGGAAFTTALPTGYVGHSTAGAAGTSGVAGNPGNNGAQFLANTGWVLSAGGGGGTSFPVATISACGNGGAGGYGCGGGGAGGAITATAAGVGGLGGAGLVIITAW